MSPTAGPVPDDPEPDPMTIPNDETAAAVRFLLGELSGEERDRFERRLVEDGAVFEQVEAAETELVDRYVLGELTAEERRRFEENLLPSERIAGRVALARRLLRVSGEEDRGEPRRQPTVAPDAGGPAGRGRTGAPGPARLAWAATVVAALAAGALGVANLRLQDRLQEVDEARLAAVHEAQRRGQELAALSAGSERELETLRRALAERQERIAGLEGRVEGLGEAGTPPPPGNREPLRPVSVSLFLAQTARAATGTAPLSLGAVEDGSAVEVQLDLDRIRPGGRLLATVERDGVTVWREDDLEPRFHGAEGMAVLVLPEEVLSPGVYRIELVTTGPEPRTIGHYRLTVRP